MLEYKSTDSSRENQGKRQVAVEETCKMELKSEMALLFQIFHAALRKASKALEMFPLHARPRGLEANIVQSCFAEELMTVFGNDKAFYGKYKRLILRAKDYLILFKKLNKKGFPMNIKTGNVQGILDQNKSVDLFSDTDYKDDPILYFGYQVGHFGGYQQPQLVYIDDGAIKFTINVDDGTIGTLPGEMEIIEPVVGSPVSPKLKQNNNIKKAI